MLVVVSKMVMFCFKFSIRRILFKVFVEQETKHGRENEIKNQENPRQIFVSMGTQHIKNIGYQRDPYTMKNSS
jgi:hypothetical protein